MEPGTFTLWDRVSLIKDSLNSSIRIQIKARISTLCSQFIPQNITALPLAVNLLLVSKGLVFHHGCQDTTVKGWWSHPPVTAIRTTTPMLSERGWRWKTMITCTTCYRCTILWQRERLYCFSLGQLVAILSLTFCTLRPAPSPPVPFFKSIEHLHTANRPFAWWRRFTTTTRILFGFLFIFKFGSPSEV